MRKRDEILTDEKFQTIYKDEEFRNQVAFAHKCCYSGGKFKHMQTCSYPVTYIVTEAHIEEAKIERARVKKETIKSCGDKLVFISMGGDYKAKWEDDVCNHRIRTEFKNDEGRLFFIEFGTMSDYKTVHVNFSIDRDLQNKMEKRTNDLFEKRSKLGRSPQTWKRYDALSTQIRESQSQPYYNYKGLERNYYLGKYTKTNLLEIVNKYFECSFEELIVDKYNLSCDDIVCQSPNQK